MKMNFASAVVLGTMLAVPAFAFAKAPVSHDSNEPFAAAYAPKDGKAKNTEKKAKKKGSDNKSKAPSESK